MIRFIKDIIKFMFWYPLRRVLPLLPLKMVYLLGDMGGSIHYRLSGVMRKVMYDEFSLIFNGRYSQKDKISIVRRTFKIMAKNQLEVLLFRSLTQQKTDRMINVNGLERLDHALSMGKGVILLIAHFGANKLVMPALGYRGYKINQVAGKPTEWIRIMGDELSPLSKKIFELELKNDKFLPANFIYVFHSMKPVFKLLKDNEVVCMAIDGGGGTKKERVGFLGREAMISAGPFRIAQRTGASILPAFVVRQQDNTHRLIINAPIHTGSDSSGSGDTVSDLHTFLNILEGYVDRYPCQYAFRLARARMLHQKDMIPLFTDYKQGKPS